MFLTKLDVSETGGGSWVLDAPLVWDDGKRRFTVPAGFVTDLDSVPRVPFAYLLFKGRARAAAALHDWLYCEGLVSRSEADAVFLDAMQATGVAWRHRWPIWLGVRLFGRGYFDMARDIRERRR